MQFHNPPAYFVTELERITNKWRQGLYKNTAEAVCFPNHPGVAIPVPFFGNIGNNKPLFFSLGSNPSDKEFLDDSGQALKTPRFFNPRHVLPSWDWQNVFEACNKYFINNPYTRWFGKQGGSKLEGFLNLLGASYYDTDEYKYQAVHVDLMPFPTEEKYVEFKKNHPCEAKEYINDYGIPLVHSMISLYKPESIICIGNDACLKLLGNPVGRSTTAGTSFSYYKGEIDGIKAFGTSIYYPDSHGSTKADWEKDVLPLI